MGRVIFLSLVLTACATLEGSRVSMQSPSKSVASQKAEVSTVTLALGRLDVNDQTLELRYTIKNDSDHEVWVCDGIGFSDIPDSKGPEVYLDDDQRTLVIRKRIVVPFEAGYSIVHDFEGRFIRVRPGQQRTDSLSLSVPVESHGVVTGRGFHPGRATRLSLEIGFYNGDLPLTMRTICEVADKFKCVELGNPDRTTWPVLDRYFSGLFIAEAFGGLSGFNDSWQEGSDEIVLPYLWGGGITIIDEPCLRITVEAVDIPYQGG
jgi:hypothetical protein